MVPSFTDVYTLSLHDALPISPTGSVEGLSATEDVQIVPIDQSKVDELIDNYPYYAADTIEAGEYGMDDEVHTAAVLDRKSTRLNSSHVAISYAVFCSQNKT